MRIIDTKIGTSNERPQIKVGNKLYSVDNRKKTFDEIQRTQGESLSNVEKEKILFEKTLGKQNAKEIFGLDLTVEEYNYLSFCIMAAITGKDVEELQKEAEKSLKN